MSCFGSFFFVHSPLKSGKLRLDEGPKSAIIFTKHESIAKFRLGIKQADEREVWRSSKGIVSRPLLGDLITGYFFHWKFSKHSGDGLLP